MYQKGARWISWRVHGVGSKMSQELNVTCNIVTLMKWTEATENLKHTEAQIGLKRLYKMVDLYGRVF